MEARLLSTLAALSATSTTTTPTITAEDLSADGALAYVGWVVMETLRLHPVAASILRKWHPGQLLGDTVSNDEVCDGDGGWWWSAGGGECGREAWLTMSSST